MGATARPAPGLPQRYYLALGDSLACGLQPDKVDAGVRPSGFDTGFVDVFARRLRKLAPADLGTEHRPRPLPPAETKIARVPPIDEGVDRVAAATPWGVGFRASRSVLCDA